MADAPRKITIKLRPVGAKAAPAAATPAPAAPTPAPAPVPAEAPVEMTPIPETPTAYIMLTIIVGGINGSNNYHFIIQ